MLLLFTKAQLEARLSSKRLKRIFDDNNDGSADTDAIDQLRKDASSKVCGFLEPIGITTRLEALVLDATGELLAGKEFPEEVVRLALDVAVAMAAQRHPEIMRMDWRALMDQAEKELKMLREGMTSLGGDESPEVYNQGGVVLSGDSTSGSPVPIRRYWDEMGDF